MLRLNNTIYFEEHLEKLLKNIPFTGDNVPVHKGMQHWIITDAGKVMCRSTDVTWAELDDPTKDWSKVYSCQKEAEYYAKIRKKIC